MGRTLVPILITVALLALGLSSPARSQPCVAVEVSFVPDTVATGESSTLSVSIENTGDEAGEVSLSLTLSFNEHTLGPLEGSIHLEAGAQIAFQLHLVVVPRVQSGTLTVDLSAGAGECVSQSVATLVIQSEDEEESHPLSLDVLAGTLWHGLTGTTAGEPASWGFLKQRY